MTLQKGQRQENDAEVNQHISFLQMRARELADQEYSSNYLLSLRCALLEEQLANAVEAMLTIANLSMLTIAKAK